MTHLVAYFPSPPQGVWYLGPVPMRAYALFIIAGIVACLVIGDRRWEARGGERGVIYDIALWAVPFGLIGGRLYHLATDWRTYWGPGGAGFGAALRIWDGGLGIWGAVALGALGAWIGVRRRGIPLPAFGDAIAPGIILAQAIGRLGNYFNQELYGRETTLPWGLEIFYRRDPSGYVDPHSLDGVSTGQVAFVVQPTFLYELIWDLLVFVALLYLDRRFTLGHGRLFAIYVAGYCIGRFGVELLRNDTATLIAGIRINVFTSTFVFIGAVVYLMLAPRGREDPESLRGTDHVAEEAPEPEPEPADELVAVASATAATAVVSARTDDESAGSAEGEADAAESEDEESEDEEPEVEESDVEESDVEESGGEEPETAKVEAEEPEAEESDVEEPETSKVEAEEPETAKVEAEEPEAEEPEAEESDVEEPETAKVEVEEPEISKVEAEEPETAKVEAVEAPEAEADEPEVTDAEAAVAEAADGADDETAEGDAAETEAVATEAEREESEAEELKAEEPEPEPEPDAEDADGEGSHDEELKAKAPEPDSAEPEVAADDAPEGEITGESGVDQEDQAEHKAEPDAKPDGEEPEAVELTTPNAVEDTTSPDAPQRSRRRLSFRLGRGGR